MATERLIIEVVERGTKRVQTRIERLGVSAVQASGGTTQLNKELRKTGRSSRTASTGLDRTKRSSDKLTKSFTGLRGALTGLGLVVATRQLIKFSDAATQLGNRLRVVTDSATQLARVQGRLFEISRETRSSVEANVELFSRLSIATRELGRSEGELLQFTESLNQAIKLSGASAQEANAGLIQLSQGLASGTLRGDELRSVLEQLPVVADVIARRLNVTRGELRRLGQDGKITAEIILDAFKDASDDLDNNFGSTVPTISEQATVLRNSIIELTGSLEELTGVGAGLAAVLAGLGKGVSQLAKDIKTSGISEALINDLFDPLTARIKTIAQQNKKGKGFPGALDEMADSASLAANKLSDLEKAVKRLEALSPPAVTGVVPGGGVDVGDPLGRLDPGDGLTDQDFSINETLQAVSDASFDGVIADLGNMQAAVSRVDNSFADLGSGIESSISKIDRSIMGLGQDIGELFVGAIDQASVALADFAIEGFKNTEDLKQAFSDLFKQLARDILAATIRLLILQALFGETGGGGGGGTGGLVGGIASLFSNNQIGGPLGSGELSLVGERGPEFFRAPQGGGRITRNEDLGNIGQPVVNLRIVNVTPEEAAGLQGEDGEEFVLNTIQKRSGEVRDTLQ